LQNLLENQVAIVTGSTGSGTGTEVARVFAAEGARVIVTGRNAEAGSSIVRQIRADGGVAEFVAADLGERDQCESLVTSAVERFGKLTCLVNCAVATLDGGEHISASGDGSIGDVSDFAWEKNVLVNLTALMWLTRRAIPELVAAAGATIVNIGSRVAERGSPNLAAYTATKGAMHALTRSIAVDYGAKRIRANTVAPGFILGKDRDEGAISDEVLEWSRKMHLTPPPTTTDVAYAAAYLASPMSAPVTGQTLLLDGGNGIARGLVLG
jgi:NAD(P)-dependent dehydrogenase (short-subunit alcohol dehydrogenase family)